MRGFCMFSVSWQRETQANRENKSGMALPAGCWNGTGSLLNPLPFISGILQKSQQTKAEARKGMVEKTQETAGFWSPALGQSLLSIGVFRWPSWLITLPL